MRCLYCGKELALLKRLTGGEFCSDAHRQQYKEEYNELALDRLLQAKNAAKANAESKAETATKKSPSGTEAERAIRPESDQMAVQASQVTRHAYESTSKAAGTSMEPEAVGSTGRYVEPVPEAISTLNHVESEPVQLDAEHAGVETDEPDPAEPTGFLLDMPAPVMAEVAKMAVPDVGLEHNPKPSPPVREPEVRGTQLVEVGQIPLEPSTKFRDHASLRSERGPESREFGRNPAAIEMKWPAGVVTALQTSEEPMEIQILPQAAQSSPRLWQEPETEFEAIETELGELARVVFRTTGIEDNIEDEGNAGSAESPATDGLAEQGGEVAVSAADAGPNGLDALTRAVDPSALVPLASPAEADSLDSLPEESPKNTAPVPDQITKPLPLTLHGLAAGRGKPVQVFNAAATGFDVQIPRSAGLPLRPVMILGPAPALAEQARKSIEKKEPERTPAKSGAPSTDSRPTSRIELRKPAAPRTDLRPEVATVRKLDTRTLQAEARQVEKRGERSPGTLPSTQVAPLSKEQTAAKAPALAEKAKLEVPKPAATEAPRALKDPVPEAPKAAIPAATAWSAPLSAAAPSVPYTAGAPASLDLGLPSLDLKKPSGFWAGIPMSAKIGVVAAALIFIGTITASIMYFSNRGPRVVEAGPALPVSDWVKDWDSGPQIRVTVLRGTLNLSDYRAQFRAQIDAKAVGWVFRAADAKNYYASKLEVVKSGAIWTAILARFAVIDGHEEPRVHVPLSFAVQENTVYKIRLDAVGDHFSTWIQDQKVDDFTDGRIKTGGVGLYSERGESALLRGDLSVIPLAIKK